MEALLSAGADPIAAVGGAVGIIIGMTQAVKLMFGWQGEKGNRSFIFCLFFSLAVATSMTLAKLYETWALVNDTAGEGIGLFLIATGIYKLGRITLSQQTDTETPRYRKPPR